MQREVWCKSGPYLEGYRFSVIIVLRALYKLKSKGAACRAMLDRVIIKTGFKSCSQDDSDVYMKKEKKINGYLFYSYLLVYVGCVPYIVEDEYGTIKMLKQFFSMKEVSLGWTDSYAGENIDIMRTTYDLVIWSMNFQ